MKSLESMEKGTPEFQSLTPNQQNERRYFLSRMLESILSQPSTLGLTQEQSVRFACDLLEFHLSGKIEKHIDPPQKRKK